MGSCTQCHTIGIKRDLIVFGMGKRATRLVGKMSIIRVFKIRTVTTVAMVFASMARDQMLNNCLKRKIADFSELSEMQNVKARSDNEAAIFSALL